MVLIVWYYVSMAKRFPQATRVMLFLFFHFFVFLISKNHSSFIFHNLLKFIFFLLRQYPFITIWFHLSGFANVFDVDYFIQQMNGFIKVVKELPPEIASKEPFLVDCSKRKGQFDYIESVLPSLLEHHYISITPAMSQRRDRYYLVVLYFLLMTLEPYCCDWEIHPTWRRLIYEMYNGH